MKRWICAVLILVFIAAVLFSLFSGTKHRVRLPDGSSCVLRDVTFGKSHRHVADNIFKRTANRFLPDKLKARLRIRELGVPMDADTRDMETLVAWIEHPVTNLSFRICDESGHEQVPQRSNASFQTIGRNRRVSGYVFASFPRRARWLTVRAYSFISHTQHLSGEFRVRNPAYRKYPQWVPESLPIKRETNDLTFTLLRFETGVPAKNEFAYMAPGWTEIEYEYGPPDFVSGPWTPTVVVISDATGNRIRKYWPTQSLVVGVRPPGKNRTLDARRRGIVSVPAMLWLDEAAWRVHLELERTGISGFHSNEIWEVNDVPVPRIGETNFVNQSTTRYGASITFESLATYEAGNRPFPNPILKLEMEYPKQSGIRIFLLGITDQRGITVRGSVPYVHPLPLESKRLNFRFAIHQVIALDFLAKPQLATTNVLNPENSLLDPARP